MYIKTTRELPKVTKGSRSPPGGELYTLFKIQYNIGKFVMIHNMGLIFHVGSNCYFCTRTYDNYRDIFAYFTIQKILKDTKNFVLQTSPRGIQKRRLSFQEKCHWL